MIRPAQLKLMERARRGMYAEGFALDQCRLEKTLRITGPHRDEAVPLGERLPVIAPGEQFSVSLAAIKPISQPSLKGRFGLASQTAVSNARRRVVIKDRSSELPLYRAEEQAAGASAAGPAVLEEAYFTCRIDPGWRFEFNDSGDVLLSRVAKA